MRVVCVRTIRVKAPADAVFESLLDPAFVFSLNLFHRAVDCDTSMLRRGSVARIDHRFFGLRRELRIARVHRCTDYRVAWGELADRGHDVFPHSQSFTIRPLSKACCAVVNELRGTFLLMGARFWTPFIAWSYRGFSMRRTARFGPASRRISRSRADDTRAVDVACTTLHLKIRSTASSNLRSECEVTGPAARVG